MFETGMLINQRYQLETEIGRGGIGIVFRAHDTLLQRKVAVKVLHTVGLGSEGRANLLREAQIIAGLHHPNIITIHDAGIVADAPYLVMELLDGKPLDQLIPLPVDTVIALLEQICAALSYAHAQGIVHRDLKPGNLLLDETGRIKLMDFGLARSSVTRMTLEGAISGTVYYLAPEQALGREVDARTDLYALGITLYELLTGELPFDGDDPIAIITQHLYAPVVPPRLKNEAIPPALNELILRMLSKEPDERPGDAAAAWDFLADHLTAQSTPVEAPAAESLLDRIVRGRMVARASELAEVDKLWTRARSGERQVLLISGEPGIGKSRLVQEAVARVEVSGGIALLGENYAEGGTPYAPFAQIVRASLRAAPANLALPEPVLADLLRLAPDLASRFPDLPPNPPLDPQAEQARLVDHLVTWCEWLCQGKPLLIGLEDAHWADSGSLSLFLNLARRTRRLPLLLFLTYREVELAEQAPLQGLLVELNRERIGTSLKLKRLDLQGTKSMLGTLFAEEITPEFLDAVYQATEGNPFFVEEVCKALVESGEVYFQHGRWQRPAIEAIHIPQSVRLAIQSRLGKLPEEAQETLRLAAVIGRDFEIELLLEASGLEEERLIGAIEVAEASQFIQELGASAGLVYRFTHALLPATLAESIHTLRRRRIHRSIAAAMQKLHPQNYEALAYHFTEGGDDPQAYRYLVLAGKKAAAAYANEEAARHFLAALNLVEDPAERAALLDELAEARQYLGLFELARENYREVAEIYLEQNNLDQAALAFSNAARAAWMQGDSPGSLEIALLGLERTPGAPDGPGLAALLSETSREYYFMGQRAAGQPYWQRAIEIARREDYREVLCEALTNRVLLGGFDRDSITYLEQAAQIAEEYRLERQLDRVLYNLCLGYEFAIGDLHKALHIALKGIEAARRFHDRSSELACTSRQLAILSELGRYDQAREVYQHFRTLQEALPPGSWSQRVSQVAETVFLAYTGQWEQATQIVEDLRTASLASQDLQMILAADIHLAGVMLTTRQTQRLEALVLEGLELGSRVFRIFELAFLSVYVTCLSREGRVEEANATMDRLTAASSQLLLPPFMREIPIYLAQAELALARGQWEQAWTTFAAAADALGALQMPFRQASTLYDWATGHLRRGQPEDIARARQLLQEAQEIHTRLGVARYAGQIQEQLQALS